MQGDEMNEVNPWWDWLLAPASSLKERGLDPTQRVANTGHIRPMSPRWAKTLGWWCRSEPGDILNLVSSGDSEDDQKRTRAAYDVFRYRHHLKLWKQFAKPIFDNTPPRDFFMQVGPVIVATMAHNRVERMQKLTQASPGSAANLAAKWEPEMMRGSSTQWFGLLPIEMLLYYYAIEQVLESTGTTHRSWAAGGGSGDRWVERAEVWKTAGGDGLVALPPEALVRYPIDHA
jgi:hypothetical protein